MTGGECERRMGGRAYRSEYASDNVNRDVRKKKCLVEWDWQWGS